MSMYGSSVYNSVYHNYINYLICYLHDWTLLIGVNIKFIGKGSVVYWQGSFVQLKWWNVWCVAYTCSMLRSR